MVTPVAWTSFLTGCAPPTHGIHEFYRVDPASRIIHPNHAGRIQVPTLVGSASWAGAGSGELEPADDLSFAAGGGCRGGGDRCS